MNYGSDSGPTTEHVDYETIFHRTRRCSLASYVRFLYCTDRIHREKKAKVSPYSITERRVPELVPVLGSQPASDVSHKPDGKLSLLSARPAVTLAILKRAATNLVAW